MYREPQASPPATEAALAAPAFAGAEALARDFAATCLEAAEVAFAARRQHFEAQRAGRWHDFKQANLYDVAEAIAFAAFRADQGMGRFNVVEVIVAERADRNIAVGAGVFQAHEKS